MSGKSSYCVQDQYVIGTDPSSCKGTMMSLEVCEPRVHSACANGEVSVIVNGEPKCTPCIAGVEDYATGTCKAACLTKENTTIMVDDKSLGKDKADALKQCNDDCLCAYVIRDKNNDNFYPVHKTELIPTRQSTCSSNCEPYYVPKEEDSKKWGIVRHDFVKRTSGPAKSPLNEAQCKQYAKDHGITDYGTNDNNPKGCIQTGNALRFSNGTRDCDNINQCIEHDEPDGTVTNEMCEAYANSIRADFQVLSSVIRNGRQRPRPNPDSFKRPKGCSLRQDGLVTTVYYNRNGNPVTLCGYNNELPPNKSYCLKNRPVPQGKRLAVGTLYNQYCKATCDNFVQPQKRCGTGGIFIRRATEAKDADGCKAACQQETDCDAYVINYGFKNKKYKPGDEMYCSLYKNCVTEATPVRDAPTTWGNLKLYTCSK